MTQWTLEPIFNSYVVVAVLALAMAALLFIAPTFRRLPSSRRWTLVAIRGLVILLVVIAMLRPTRVSSTTRPQSAVLLVLFDQSRSMQLPDVAASKSRWQAQRDCLQQARQELLRLQKEISVKVYGYDQQLRPLNLEANGIAFPPTPTGRQTDIGSTLDEAVQRELGQRIAGVILLGDGAQTAYAPRVDVQQAGRTLARLESPLYTIAFGPRGDAAQARDVAVESLPEQYTVFVKNELPVKGVVRVRGYVNQTIPVELIVDDPSGRSFSAGAVQVQAREDGQQLAVEIPFTPTQAGQYKLTLRTKEQPGELVASNNQLSAFLTVLEGGLRVLYLYGDLLGEQRLLRRSIDASPDIQLDDAFVDPRGRDRWPVDLTRAMTSLPFDAMLLEGVDAAALGEASLKAIAASVEQGKGLMMIGGFQSFGPGGYAGTALADVLPVEMGRLERQNLAMDRQVSRDLHLWGPSPMLPVRPHPILRLSADQGNDTLWRSLPPLDGANRFTGIKPRAMVLAETPAGEPLLVAGEYGKGRVLAFAGNGTHRWWQYGRQAEHRRFWRQVILWLAQRDDAAQSEVWVKLAQRRFDPGAHITFTAGAKAPTGDVISDADFQARLRTPDGKQLDLRIAGSNGEISGTIEDLQQPGDYLLEVEARKGDQSLGKARANLQILDRDAELSNPAANYDLMARLANLTKQAGGKPLAAEQLPALLQEMRQRRPQMLVEVQTRWQLADTAWDGWLFLLALVGMLTSEWALRKRWGLV